VATKTAKKFNDPAQMIERIIQAIEEYDLATTPAWNEVRGLADTADFEGVEVEPSGIEVTGDKFEGVMTVYALLHYVDSSPSAPEFAESEAFNGSFRGHFVQSVPHIDQVEINVSSYAA